MTNFRHNAVLLTHNGVTDTVSGWARRTGMKWSTLNARLWAKHWTIERALETPVSPRKKRKPIAPFHYRVRADGRRVIDRKRHERDQAALEDQANV